MKKLVAVSLMLSNLVFGQATTEEKKEVNPFKKGSMFVFWGWNRAGFSNSDIRFRGDGYDFTLNNVVAHDRPSELSIAYIDPGQISKPQFNFRASYFIKDNLYSTLLQSTNCQKFSMYLGRSFLYFK